MEKNEFLKKYDEEHRYCPKCGSGGCWSTEVFYSVDMQNTHLYKDLNQAVCNECDYDHVVHDRVKEQKDQPVVDSVIASVEVVLKLDKLYEDVLGVEPPYYVRRIAKSNEVLWLGLETNWRFVHSQWYSLEKGEWKMCTEPKYETIYKLEINK